jgi:hypothetical protein
LFRNVATYLPKYDALSPNTAVVRDWKTFTFGAEEEAPNFSETLIPTKQQGVCFISEFRKPYFKREGGGEEGGGSRFI